MSLFHRCKLFYLGGLKMVRTIVEFNKFPIG